MTLLSGAILGVGSGYTLSSFSVSKGITLDVLSGGTANNAVVKAGGVEIVTDGGTENGATVSSGGTFVALGSASVNGDTFLGGAVVEVGSGFAHPLIVSANSSGVPVQFIVLSGGTLSTGAIPRGYVVNVRSGGVASGLTIDSGGSLIVSAGGTELDATVSGGGKLIVSSGGFADPTIILGGGTEIVGAQGTDFGAQISGGVQLVFGVASGATAFSGAQIVRSGGIASGTLMSGGIEAVSSGGSALATTIESGGTALVSAGGIEISGAVQSSGVLKVFGGTATGDTVGSGGSEVAVAGGHALGALILSGGLEVASSGGSAIDATIQSGGTAVILSGGFGTVLSGGTLADAGALINSGTLNVLSGGTLAVVTSSISNTGTINLLGGGAADSASLLIQVSDGTVILSGGGKVLLSSSGNNLIGGFGNDALINIDNTIAGAGRIGDGNGTFTFSNGGIVNANTKSALSISLAAAIGNASGTMEATSTGGLSVKTNGTLDNSGGKIEALGKSAAVLVDVLSGVLNSGGLILASGAGAIVNLETAVSGGTLKTSAGASMNTFGAAFSDVTIASGSLISVAGSGSGNNTLQAYGNIVNFGTIVVSGGTGFNVIAFGSATLTGGGTIALAPSDPNNGVIAQSSGTVFTNVDNVISGAGYIGVGNTELTFINSGIVNANVNFSTLSGQLAIDQGAANINWGTLEATKSGGLVLGDTTITNSGTGRIVASGAAAEVILDGATISGGLLRTSGASAMIVTRNGTDDAIVGATIASKSLIKATTNATLTLSGGTMSAGAIVEAVSTGKIIISGTIVNSGGTIFASSIESEVDITSHAVVSGGIVEVGRGTVHVESGGSANIVFLATASGGVLEIEDSANHASAFVGTVSGFGGTNHSNHQQFIDLVSVTSAGIISVGYTPNGGNTGGVLTVTSDSNPVASITLIGSYSATNFSARDNVGHVEIFDPTVPNGGSVEVGTAGAFPRDGIDLPNIAFGAQTTLAYSENTAGTGGTLTVSEGRHAAAIALIGSYIAGSFVLGADGHGGTLVTEASQTAPPLLTHPPHG